MLRNKRRFYVIDELGNQRTVNPVNFNGKYVFERKLSEGQWFFRKKLSENVEFTNTNGSNDYSYFADKEYFNISRCSEFTFVVEVLCDQSEWTEEWRGRFSTGKGSYDRDNCRWSVPVDRLDEYTCLFDGYKQEFNILDASTKVTAMVDIESEYEFFVIRDTSPLTGSNLTTQLLARPEPEDSWKLFYQTSQSIISPPDFDYVMIWVRETATTNCVAGDPVPPTGEGWTLYSEDCGGAGIAVYVRQPLQDWTTLNNPEVAYGDCPNEEPPQTITLTVAKVDTPSDLTVSDILGADFLRTTLVNISKSYFLHTPTNSSVIWAVENDTAGVVVSSSTISQDEFEITYNYGLLLDQTFDVVAYETTPCGDVVEHRKTVTVRHPTSLTAGNNTYIIDAPECICINQTEQTFIIPDEYRECISSVAWSINSAYVELLSSTTYTITVKPIKTVPSGTTPAMLVTATITTCESDIEIIRFNGFIRTAVYTDDIQGPTEVCTTSTGLKFRVPERFGAVYTWSISGGTITAGNGTNEITVTASGVTGDMVITVKEDTTCGCTWIKLSDCTDVYPPIYWCFSGAHVDYSNSVLLKEAISYILENIACDDITGFCSDLFDWNAVGDTPGYSFGINYVNGLTNQYNYLVLVHKSDAKDPNASNPATIGKASFYAITKWLHEMFQVYWFIENGKIRFEHISALDEPMGLDLTQSRFADEMKKSNRYSYNEKERPKYERFSFAESGNQDFIGDDIWYNTSCADKDAESNVLEHTVPDITTDIEFVLRSPEDIDKDGFVMLATTLGSLGYSTIVDVGMLSLSSVTNAPLSWANLHDTFFRHFRYWSSGFLNSNYEQFYSWRNNVIQDQLQLKFCCELINWDPSRGILTPLSRDWFNSELGSTEKAEYDISKETLKLTIGYPR